MMDMKTMTTGREIAGQKSVNRDYNLTTLSTQVAQKRAWPQGTSATPSRCPTTSPQLSTADGVAGDVEVVPVATAGRPNAVADGRLSSPLVGALWRGCRAYKCARRRRD